MLIFAFDQSSTITGYSVWLNNNLIEHGKFKLKKFGSFLDRAIACSELIVNLIEQNKKEHPQEKIKVIFEDIQLQDTVSVRGVSNGFGTMKEEVNIRTFKTLAMLLGILQTEVIKFDKDIEINLVLPIVWKRAVGIKSTIRPEQKAEAIQKVQNLYSFTPLEDEAEAILIGYNEIKKDCF